MKLLDKQLLALPKAKRKILEGSRIYVDPSYAPTTMKVKLDLMAFLVDKVVIYEPTRTNLIKWNYPQARFSEFVKHRVFVPLYVENPGESDADNYLTRKEILNDPDFFPQYEEAVEDDLEDNSFIRLVRLHKRDPNDVAFNVNWDLIVAQAIGAPILTTSKLRSVWQYKIGKFMDTLEQPVAVRHHDVLQSFLYRALDKLPVDLTVEDILQFRREKRAMQFRNWLNSQLQEAMRARRILKTSPDEELFRSFSEVVNEYTSKTSNVSATLTAITTALVALVAPQLAPIPAISGQYVFSSLVKTVWKRFGPNNWVFMMLSVKGHR